MLASCISFKPSTRSLRYERFQQAKDEEEKMVVLLLAVGEDMREE